MSEDIEFNEIKIREKSKYLCSAEILLSPNLRNNFFHILFVSN